jgi:AraC-like DNA-binding protein
MNNGTGITLTFSNIADLMRRIGLPGPLHPLIALVNYDIITPDLSNAGNRFLLDFYKISFKNSFNGSVKYGPGTYDFKEGGLAFVAPNQLVEMTANSADYQGYALYFHPDLLYSYPLAQNMNKYGFFSYAVAEALFLSEKEKAIITSLFEAIAFELTNNIDQFSQDVFVSQLGLLLDHSNRFYNRQFLTRKPLNHDLITRMYNYLTTWNNDGNGLLNGTPSAQEIATHLKVSQRYLSDMLKSLTGKTTQQHIHLQLIEKAKELLATSTLTTAEIAYRLGFEHPQSFNKLFKQKTKTSPALFRQSCKNL